MVILYIWWGITSGLLVLSFIINIKENIISIKKDGYASFYEMMREKYGPIESFAMLCFTTFVFPAIFIVDFISLIALLLIGGDVNASSGNNINN